MPCQTLYSRGKTHSIIYSFFMLLRRWIIRILSGERSVSVINYSNWCHSSNAAKMHITGRHTWDYGCSSCCLLMSDPSVSDTRNDPIRRRWCGNYTRFGSLSPLLRANSRHERIMGNRGETIVPGSQEENKLIESV